MLFNEMNPLIMHLDVKAMPNCHKNLYSLTQFLYMFYCEPVIVAGRTALAHQPHYCTDIAFLYFIKAMKSSFEMNSSIKWVAGL